MPEQRIRIEETVYYEVSVEAETEEEARTYVQEQLDGWHEDDLDIVEVDSSSMRICDH